MHKLMLIKKSPPAAAGGGSIDILIANVESLLELVSDSITIENLVRGAYQIEAIVRRDAYLVGILPSGSTSADCLDGAETILSLARRAKKLHRLGWLR